MSLFSESPPLCSSRRSPHNARHLSIKKSSKFSLPSLSNSAFLMRLKQVQLEVLECISPLLLWSPDDISCVDEDGKNILHHLFLSDLVPEFQLGILELFLPLMSSEHLELQDSEGETPMHNFFYQVISHDAQVRIIRHLVPLMRPNLMYLENCEGEVLVHRLFGHRIRNLINVEAIKAILPCITSDQMALKDAEGAVALHCLLHRLDNDVQLKALEAVLPLLSAEHVQAEDYERITPLYVLCSNRVETEPHLQALRLLAALLENSTSIEGSRNKTVLDLATQVNQGNLSEFCLEAISILKRLI